MAPGSWSRAWYGLPVGVILPSRASYVRVSGADLQLLLGERLSARAVHAFARHVSVGP
jgi:hypothetical protein